MGQPYKYTREVLEPLVAEATSVAGVLRLLGLRQNGGSHAHISRTIKKLGLDTSHFIRYQNGARRLRFTPEQILIRRPPGSPRVQRPLLRRALKESGIPYECTWCGLDGTWRGLPLTLEIDHIDGDFENNCLENLRYLCPNCHRQTANFAGRSTGRYSGTTLALTLARQAEVVELVDTRRLDRRAFGRVGSSPAFGTPPMLPS